MVVRPYVDVQVVRVNFIVALIANRDQIPTFVFAHLRPKHDVVHMEVVAHATSWVATFPTVAL